MENKIEKAKSLISDADALLIGASNGLSIAEGYNIFADNEMFRRDFGEFRQRFGIRNVLEGVFYQYPSALDRHEFLKKLVKIWGKDYHPSEVMMNLRKIAGDKDYFILTTNADEHLEKAGFSSEKIWEIEGTFLQLLHGRASENKQVELNAFLSKYSNQKLVIFELGIGSKNRIIKLPLMQLTMHEPKASYITLNLPHEIFIPQEITSKSIALPGDIAETLRELK